MVYILVLLIISVTVLWIYGFISANDFSVPLDGSLHFKKVLIIFPHADDEVQSMGGFLKKLSNEGSAISWMILTKGEKGNALGIPDPQLAEIRILEAKKAAEFYGVMEIIQKDYPDGGTEKYFNEIKKDIRQIVEKIKPDLVLTYDLAGLYGHPDHITVAKAVTDVVETEFPDVELWYLSFPKKLLKKITLPEFMAEDPKFREKRMYPNERVFVGLTGIFTKMNVISTYKSQL